MAAAVTALIGLLAVWVAYFVGVRQGRAAEKTLALSINKATPKIGSRASLVRSSPPNRPDVTRYTINTTIYNDGDLVARNLEGEWKLTASHGIDKANRIIRANSLPSFLPLPLEHQVGGDVSVFWCDPDIVCHVDIDLTYIGMDNSAEKYRAAYKYDFSNKCFIPQ